MPGAVRLRDDYSAEELRALAKRSRDANQSRRLLSLAAIRDGKDRGEAAKIGAMDRQTLRDWFTASTGRDPTACWTIGRAVRRRVFLPINWPSSPAIVETGPDRKVDGVVALASDRSQARHRRAVRRRLSPTLCRQTPQEARLFPT